MDRRNAVLALLALGVPPPLAAQPITKPARIAYLAYLSPQTLLPYWDNFKRGMRDLGYIEGRSVEYEVRYAMGNAERIPGLVKEVVALKPDLIVAFSSSVVRVFLK